MKKQYQHIVIGSQSRSQANWPVACFIGKPGIKTGIVETNFG